MTPFSVVVLALVGRGGAGPDPPADALHHHRQRPGRAPAVGPYPDAAATNAARIRGAPALSRPSPARGRGRGTPRHARRDRDRPPPPRSGARALVANAAPPDRPAVSQRPLRGTPAAPPTRLARPSRGRAGRAQLPPLARTTTTRSPHFRLRVRLSHKWPA